jgi:2-amino-4-hydroxy-6-hydroxymethyldihydropteridine diphosphokinase
MNSVIIEFGSNIKPEANIAKAKECIRKVFIVVKESGLLRTKPFGVSDQDDYVNCAVMVETGMTPEEMKTALNVIESDLGRIHGADKFAPRTIDLDIIVWNGKVIHKDFHEREYIRINVGEIMPELKNF